MTCDVQLQLVEVLCAVATFDVCAEPIMIVTWDVRVCGALQGLRSGTAYRRLFWQFIVSYAFVAQKWRFLAIFGKLLGRYWDLKQCLKAKIIN